MISLSMISFLFGAALGQRFKVVILVPAMAIVMAFSLVFTRLQAAWQIVGIAVTAALCLQCGYFVGIVVRNSLVANPSRGSLPFRSAETSRRQTAR
jgi:hypothetical protein